MAAFFAKVKNSFNTAIQQFFTSTWKKIMNDEVLVTNTQIIGVVGICLFILGVIVETNILPSMRESRIQKEIALERGSLRRESWSKLPFLYELRVYVFNVTNPDGIAIGEKPVLREIGPFVYDVLQVKTNQIDDEENDTVTYSVRNTYNFNIGKSILTDDTELTLAHFLTFGTPNAVMKDHASLISMAAKAVDSLGRNPTSLFAKQTVETFLFDGQILSCEGIDEFFGRASCNNLHDYAKYRMRKRTEVLYDFSIFGHLNETDIYHGKVRIRRGIKDMKDVGVVLEYNDMKNISIWKNDECDKFRGTEGTMFRPYLRKMNDEYLYVTNTFYCRTLIYKYESKIKYKGLKLLRYTTTIGTKMATNKNDKCYCIAPDRCLKNGVFEIWRCFNNAFILSNPHFYLASPSYVDGVEGVKPIKDKHMIILDIDPLTGLVVRSHFRIQYNFQLMNLKKYRLMKDVRDALFPLLWADEVMVLPDFVIKRIKNIYNMITIVKVVGYLMICIGLAMCGYALYCEFQPKKE